MQTENGQESLNTVAQEDNNQQERQQAGVEAGWKFEPSDTSGLGPVTTQSPASFPANTQPISWTASEYVAHHKSPLWFIGLGLVVSVLALITYFVTSEIITTVVTVVIGLSFGIFGARPPQVLQYSLDEKGLHISGKLYPYERIKSFCIRQEGPIHSVLLIPLQRFMPPISVYYDQADEDKIMNVITAHIPHEEQNPDIVERFMSKIRF